MVDPLVALTVALSLATLFGAAATHKLLGWRELGGVVENYRVLPTVLARPVAAALPAIEALIAVAVVVPATRPAGGVAGALLLCGYGAAIALNLRRGRTYIDCGCFGSRLGRGVAPWMVVRNLLLAALATALALPVSSRPLAAMEVGVALALVATLAVLYPVAEIVARMPPPTFDENFAASRARGAHPGA